MKKIISLLLMLILVFTLSACNGDVVSIEDYEWKMGAVMRNDIEAAQNEYELVVAVGEEDDIHPTPKGTDYEVTIDGIKGYATVAPTEYYDSSEVPTLPINLGEFSLYFTPVE